MTKGLIFSDLHVHNHKGSIKRLNHCIEVLEWTFEQTIANECDYLFFLGDLFHDRTKIDVLIYQKTFGMITDYVNRNNFDLYLLVGNHDMYHKERWDVNSVKILSAIPRIHIVDFPQQIELSGTKIDWLPHVENPIDELNQLRQNAGDILFSHLAVHNAKLNVCYGTRADVIVEHDNDMVPVEVGMFDDWAQVFLGHYHGAQQLSKSVEYVGSPLQLSFGEAFQQKHLILLDLETKEKTYIVNDFSPQHLIVKPEDVEHHTYNLSDNFVRVAVSDIGQRGLIDLKKKINEEYSPLSLDIKQHDRKTTENDSDIVEEARSILKDNREMLKTYMKDRGVPDNLDEAHLLKLGFRCLEKQT